MLMPTIRRQAEFSFRKLRPDLRKEMVDEAVVNALAAYARLVERGREDLAFPSSLADYAVKQIREGRHIGSRLNIKDVSSRYAQQRKRFRVDRLDQFDADAGEWQEILVEDQKSGPADIAASRIDFAAWLATLSSLRRRIAECLATGECTLNAARRFSVSPGRISQLRREFQTSWQEFHGEAALPAPRRHSAAIKLAVHAASPRSRWPRRQRPGCDFRRDAELRGPSSHGGRLAARSQHGPVASLRAGLFE